MNQSSNPNSASSAVTSQATPVDWQAKYRKEHDRKKRLNKQKKKAYKNVKKLTKANQTLKAEIKKLKTASFIHEHDYF